MPTTGQGSSTVGQVAMTATADSDKREAILTRLVDIFTEIEGVNAVLRNQVPASANNYPAIILFDADEMLNVERAPAGPHTQSPILIDMRPEVYVFLSGQPESIGPELNVLRRKILKAVLTDSVIRQLVYSNGGVTFDGYATALAMGRKMDAQAAIQFTFTYVLRPQDL